VAQGKSVFLMAATVVNLGTGLALGELVRLHIYLQIRGITTLEYLIEKDEVSKISKVKVKLAKQQDTDAKVLP